MLKIGDKEYDTKFNYTFADRLTHDYSNDQADGFDRLLGEIIDRDPNALVAAYRYALDVPTKELPSLDDVASALDANGTFAKGEKAFNELFKQLKANGFLALKLKQFINSRKALIANSKATLSAVSNKDDKQATKVALKQAETAMDQINKTFEQLSK